MADSDQLDIEKFYGLNGNQPAAAQAPQPSEIESHYGLTPSVGSITVEPDKMQPDLLVRRNADRTGPVSVIDPRAGQVVKQFTPQEWAQREADTQEPRYGSFARGFEDLPLVGPTLTEAVKKTAAAARALSNGTSYSDERKAVDAIDNQLMTQHPSYYGAGKLAGGAAGYGAAVAAFPGLAPYLGLGPGAVGGRLATAGLTNGLIGGADAYIRNENPGLGAAFGVGGGIAGTLGGELLGMGGRELVNRVGRGINRLTDPVSLSAQGIDRPAANKLVEKLAQDDPTAVQQRLTELGPLATPADAGPNLEALAGGVASKGGEGLSAINATLEGRRRGTTGRLQNDLTAAMGPAEDPVAVTGNIRDARRAADAINYEAVHNAAPPVDASGVVQQIDRQLETATGLQRAALTHWRQELVRTPERQAADGSVIPETYQDNSRILHNLRQDIDRTVQYGNLNLGVLPGALSREAGSVSSVRGALDRTLKEQVPGMREADAESAEWARKIEAVERGANLLDAGKSAEWPESFATDYRAMPVGEQLALNKGVRGELGRLTGVKKNDVEALRTALQVDQGGEGGWNTDKLRTAWGDQAVDRLLGAVNREKTFETTNQNILKNSKTAPREAAKADLEQGNPEASKMLQSASLLGMGLSAGKNYIVNPLMNILLNQRGGAYQAQVARGLMAQGPERDTIVNGLLRRHAQNQAVSSVANPVGNAADYASNLLLRSAGAGYRPGSPAR